jgi:hypothetical protein
MLRLYNLELTGGIDGNQFITVQLRNDRQREPYPYVTDDKLLDPYHRLSDRFLCVF